MQSPRSSHRTRLLLPVALQAAHWVSSLQPWVHLQQTSLLSFSKPHLEKPISAFVTWSCFFLETSLVLVAYAMG